MKKNILFPIWILLLFISKLAVAQYTGTLPTPFIGCMGTAFQVSGVPSTLQTVNLVTGTTTNVKSYTFSINAMGFSEKDNRLWGLEVTVIKNATDDLRVPTGYLVAIGRDYSYVKIPLVFPTTNDKFVANTSVNEGSITETGYLYVINENIIFTIDVNPTRATFGQVKNTGISLTLNPDKGTRYNIRDWAFLYDSDINLYSVANGYVLRINSATGVVTRLTTTGANLNNSDFFGAVFVDNQGNLYCKSNTSGQTYKIANVVNATGPYNITSFSNNVSSDNNDAAGCRLAAQPINGDFGDAPLSYSTIGASDGARHVVSGTPAIYFGATVTTETDAREPLDATGDGGDDGFVPKPVTTTSVTNQTISYTLKTRVYNNTGATAYVYGWIDWNSNGGFDVEERVGPIAVPTGKIATTDSVTLTWSNATLSGVNGQKGTYGRFRISTDNVSASRKIGQAPDGEVEDYWIPYSIALPVRFGEIKAKITDGNLVVTWQTVAEQNNDHFDIEVSKDGIKFSKLATIKTKASNGNSDKIIDYDYSSDKNTDLLSICILSIFFLLLLMNKRNKPLLFLTLIMIVSTITVACYKAEKHIDVNKEGKLYVRIVQVDIDGKKNYSKIITASEEN